MNLIRFFYILYVALITIFLLFRQIRKRNKVRALLDAKLEEFNQATNRCQYCRSTSFNYEYITQTYWHDCASVMRGGRSVLTRDGATVHTLEKFIISCSNCNRGAWHYEGEYETGWSDDWEDEKTTKVTKDELIEKFATYYYHDQKVNFTFSVIFIVALAFLLLLAIPFGWI